jgi:acetoin utilization deacetylase AcuC-like enzyme
MGLPPSTARAMPASLPVAWITHPDCRRHEIAPGHPESPLRLAAIEDRMIACGYADFMQHHEAPEVRREDLERVHNGAHIAQMLQWREIGAARVDIDGDTAVTAHTVGAALRAAGAGVLGVDLLLQEKASLAFCAVRPPGHHAERARAMGFCYFSNAAIAAKYALSRGLERVAVLDFDLHYGNGTADCIVDEPRIVLLSTYQHALYPHWRSKPERDNLVDVPLAPFADGASFRQHVVQRWLPALEAQRPELIVVSAGFDAHAADPLGDLQLHYEDFQWIGGLIRDVADATAQGRVLATLEGGYDLTALARSVEAFLTPFLGGDALPL